MFFCAISGEPPQDPVVSSKSGHIYERRLIQKYITDNGTDPLTGDKLEEADLVSVKASPNTAPPRPPTQSSIPALLHTLQNEWDALVLETFALKQQFNSTRQELSYALYAQDAASRVVARLIRERDAAREALASVQANLGLSQSEPVAEDVEMTEEGSSEGLPKAIVDLVDTKQQELSSARKKRKTPDGYVKPAGIKTLVPEHTIPSLHSSSPAGITALAVSTNHPSQFLTGGNDKVVQLYDRSTDKVLATLKGHTKKVKHVAFRELEGEPTLLMSAGADKIAKIWAHDASSEEYVPKYTIRTHKGELTGLAVHPTSTLLGLSSLDKTYSIHDLSTFGQVHRSPEGEDAFTSLGIHPDGTLLALGTPTSSIQLYDLRSGVIAASLTPEGGSPFTVHSLSFSENGYHLAAPYASSSVAIWDLRKQKMAKEVNLGEGFKVNKVLYDYSAQYLGIAGSAGLKVLLHKSWEELVHFQEAGDVADFIFGPHGMSIWGASGREVRVWGAPT